MKRALFIGNDSYTNINDLTGCINDAISMENTLKKNGDGSPNFDTSTLINATTSEMLSGITSLFTGGDADVVLLYFAGHGLINPETNAGYIVSIDGNHGSYGIALSEILNLANTSYPRIKSTIIMLDSCHSGFAGETSGINNNVSFIGSGVTILTACHRNETALEEGGNGLFTSIVLDGLGGSSADILGRITPSSIYSHVDQTLGAWEQRPIYKANVRSFVTLREVSPKIELETLRRLPTYFPSASSIYPLDPSFEPDRENIPEELRSIPVNEENIKIFKELQACNKHGLVTPHEAEHMYYAAINSTGCKLTSLGAHYRNLAERSRI